MASALVKCLFLAHQGLVEIFGTGRDQSFIFLRQTWEYRVDYAPTSYDPRSGNTLKYVDPKKSEVLLNQRGAEGWELVGVGQWLYYFKRAR